MCAGLHQHALSPLCLPPLLPLAHPCGGQSRAGVSGALAGNSLEAVKHAHLTHGLSDDREGHALLFGPTGLGRALDKLARSLAHEAMPVRHVLQQLLGLVPFEVTGSSIGLLSYKRFCVQYQQTGLLPFAGEARLLSLTLGPLVGSHHLDLSAGYFASGGQYKTASIRL